MQKPIVFFNPLSDSGKGRINAERIPGAAGFEFADITEPDSFSRIAEAAADGRRIIICGGDGTLNRFANRLRDENFPVPDDLFYYATGSGNDFLKDIGARPGSEPVRLAPYLASLPTVTVGGEERLFITGVGFGIDGYCCEVGDRYRAEGRKKTDYTAIALRGLFGDYSPRDAEITVDGKTCSYEGVWLAPIMNGRYFGGGMMPAPDQDRLDPEGMLTLMLFCGKGRLATLIKFPRLFRGTHTGLRDCHIFKGHEITVKYAVPTALQVDGETVPGALECRCLSSGLRRTLGALKAAPQVLHFSEERTNE